jgi:phosphatidylglycerophosphate synthase
MTKFSVGLAVLVALALLAPLVYPPLAEISGLWWQVSVVVFSGVTLVSRNWVSRSRTKSNAAVVASINGATAMKMFTMLILVTSYLLVHEEGRVPYAIGMFVVFVVQLVLFVADAIAAPREPQKNS